MIQGESFSQQYILQKGLDKFVYFGVKLATKEEDQLHRRHFFQLIDISELDEEEKRKAMEALVFLTPKINRTIKGLMVYNRKPTRDCLSQK